MMKVADLTLEFVPAQSERRALSQHSGGPGAMCVQTMDIPAAHCSKHKAVSKMKWKMLRTRTTEDTFKMLHKTVKSAAARRCVHKGKPPTARPGKEGEHRRAARGHSDGAFTHRRPGAMAPGNTTQYLMENVYADMSPPLGDSFSPRSVYDTAVDVYGESLSPTSVSTALDSIYDDYLAFQQRDFEEVFGL